MEKDLSTGKCSFCKENFAYGDMHRHLKACPQKKAYLQKLSEKPDSDNTGIYHLFVEGRFQNAYWMHLEIHSDATLRDLDQFLRSIWLECCGHLSEFTIDQKRYHSELFEDLSPPWRTRIEVTDMDVELHQALRPGIIFHHEYDFGTPTELTLRVISYFERKGRGERIVLLARNNPPLILCDDCGRRKATLICTSCSWTDESWFCDLCAERHGCDKEMFLPIVNSPRTGECGYTGHSWDPSKTIKDEDPCSCGSGKSYLHCCWVRDALWAKKEKSTEAFSHLKDAAEEKVFTSEEEFQAFSDDMMEGYNREPDADFLGFSSEQIARLLYHPLERNSDIVRINKDISPNMYEMVPIVRNTRLFLAALAEAEPLNSTAKGNLPVRFAKPLFDQIEESRFKEYISFRSEENSPTVLTLRHILKLGGWIKKEKKQFKLTRRGHNVLTDGFTEPHFYRLLNTFAVKFNWAFQDRYPPLPIIQRSWLFSLFLLHEKAKKYTEDAALAKFFIKAFPEAIFEIDSLYTSEFEYLTRCFSIRFLERFCEYFGFVECRREKQKELFSVRLSLKTNPLFETCFIWGVH